MSHLNGEAFAAATDCFGIWIMKFNSLIKAIFRIINQTTLKVIQTFFINIDLAITFIKNKVIGVN